MPTNIIAKSDGAGGVIITFDASIAADQMLSAFVDYGVTSTYGQQAMGGALAAGVVPCPCQVQVAAGDMPGPAIHFCVTVRPNAGADDVSPDQSYPAVVTGGTEDDHDDDHDHNDGKDHGHGNDGKDRRGRG